MMPMEPDHYGVLELPPGSPIEDVKSQYRRLAKRYHPDLHGDDVGFQEKFRRVNAAYTFLSDAPRKAAYDAVLQAARKAGAPPLKAAPPPEAAPRTAEYQTPGAGAGFHPGTREQSSNDIRMTRSAWLGATAGAIVVLLVIGLSVDGSGPGRLAPAGVTAPPAPMSASGSVPGSSRRDGSESGGGSEPSAATGSLDGPPPAVSAAPIVGATVIPRPRDISGIAPPTAPKRSGIAGSAWLPPPAIPPTPAGMDPADALRRRLLARYHVVLPRTDQLMGRGYAVCAADRDTGDGSRRILREQLAADLADLGAVRARLRPALVRLSQQGTPEEVRQEAGPIQVDLDRLADAHQPVRDDITALAALPTALAALPTAARAAPTAARAAPTAAFHFGPPHPVRAASVLPPHIVPNYPMPAVAAVHLEVPKPPEKPVPAPAVTPRPPTSSGQDFIMWVK